MLAATPWKSSLTALLGHEPSAAARFAAEEFLWARVRNPHTRTAYQRAVVRFLAWTRQFGPLQLAAVTPAMVARYLDSLAEAGLSVPSRKQHLAALRHFFDVLVVRHVTVLNPAASVRGERFDPGEGKTPEIALAAVRQLLDSLAGGNLSAVRDRAILATLFYTAARAGAVVALRVGDWRRAGDGGVLEFAEKGGKRRAIPVNRSLAQILERYRAAACLDDPEAWLFSSVNPAGTRLTGKPLSGGDVCRMMKRRLKAAGLNQSLSPHSFRVTAITQLLEQGIPLEQVQYLAGHADPRTTRLYDRRQQRVTRAMVELLEL